jgi:hypothetical protein
MPSRQSPEPKPEHRNWRMSRLELPAPSGRRTSGPEPPSPPWRWGRASGPRREPGSKAVARARSPMTSRSQPRAWPSARSWRSLLRPQVPQPSMRRGRWPAECFPLSCLVPARLPSSPSSFLRAPTSLRAYSLAAGRRPERSQARTLSLELRRERARAPKAWQPPAPQQASEAEAARCSLPPAPRPTRSRAPERRASSAG